MLSYALCFPEDLFRVLLSEHCQAILYLSRECSSLRLTMLLHVGLKVVLRQHFRVVSWLGG